MARMRKSDTFTTAEEPDKPQLPLQYPYYTVHHNEDALYTLKKWDGNAEPADQYMISLRPVSCTCQGMRHFYVKHREEEHKHIKVVRMWLADNQIDKNNNNNSFTYIHTFTLRAYWMDKKGETVLSRVLMTEKDMEL